MVSKVGNGESRSKLCLLLWCPGADLIRLFLVDGIISLPIAVAGFFFIPDVPEIAEPFYLTKEVYLLNYSKCGDPS